MQNQVGRLWKPGSLWAVSSREICFLQDGICWEESFWHSVQWSINSIVIQLYLLIKVKVLLLAACFHTLCFLPWPLFASVFGPWMEKHHVLLSHKVSLLLMIYFLAGWRECRTNGFVKQKLQRILTRSLPGMPHQHIQAESADLSLFFQLSCFAPLVWKPDSAFSFPWASSQPLVFFLDLNVWAAAVERNLPQQSNEVWRGERVSASERCYRGKERTNGSMSPNVLLEIVYAKKSTPADQRFFQHSFVSMVLPSP